MKVEIKRKEEKKDKPFPKLMWSEVNGRIVYFLKPKLGMQLNYTYRIADPTPHYSNDWNMSNFKDFEGEIILSND